MEGETLSNFRLYQVGQGYKRTSSMNVIETLQGLDVSTMMRYVRWRCPRLKTRDGFASTHHELYAIIDRLLEGAKFSYNLGTGSPQ